MRLLFFGDIIGKAGRKGIEHQLPLWRKELSPDLLVANIENIAHGKGIGEQKIKEMLDLNIDVLTGGNHVFEGKGASEILNNKFFPVIRPLNAPVHLPGKGFITLKGPNETRITIVSLMGQVYMRQNFNSPFEAVETLLEDPKVKQNIIIIDWHAEATSEKTAMGWFLDGKASAVVGTHTHVPTADAKILPKGTAYITDVGMVGAYNSIIGDEIEESLKRFKNQAAMRVGVEEKGPMEINAVLIEINEENKKATSIQHLRRIVEL